MRNAFSAILLFLAPFIFSQIGSEKDMLIELLNLSEKHSDFSKYIDRIKAYGLHISIPLICPVNKEKDEIKISSHFGHRTHPVDKTRKLHTGIDFSCLVATNIYATADGTVFFRGVAKGYGKCIKIRNSFGFETYYAHLTAFYVKSGDRVKRGQIIGFVGSTGKSTGDHLHYEIRKNNKPINPVDFI